MFITILHFVTGATGGELLPPELQFQILSSADIADLTICTQMSKRWRMEVLPKISHLYVIQDDRTTRSLGSFLVWGLCKPQNTFLFQSHAARSSIPLPCQLIVKMLNDNSIAFVQHALNAVMQHASAFRPIDTLRVITDSRQASSVLESIPPAMATALESLTVLIGQAQSPLPHPSLFLHVHFSHVHSLTLVGVRTSVSAILPAFPQLRHLCVNSRDLHVVDWSLIGNIPHLVDLEVGTRGWEGVAAAGQQLTNLTRLGCVFNAIAPTLNHMAPVLSILTKLRALSLVYIGTPVMEPAAIISTQTALNSIAVPLSGVQVLRVHVPCALLIPAGFTSLQSLSVNPVMQGQAPLHVQRLIINNDWTPVPAGPFHDGITHMHIPHDAGWTAAACNTVTHLAMTAVRCNAVEEALFHDRVAAGGFPHLEELVLLGCVGLEEGGNEDPLEYHQDARLLHALGSRPDISCLKRVTVRCASCSIIDQSGQAVVDALCTLQALTHVGVSGFVLTPAIVLQLASMGNMKRVYIQSDQISDQMCDDVQAQMAGRVRILSKVSLGSEGCETWPDWWCVVK